ncbi:hypothetical protein CPB83DRAFT_841091 [Crepidotus variabilis]|uniref:Uncharacterized protein n=1 Tax=Crepidotus variabilis TaxID=179855 RepID=A0A9P6JHP3_9AGAR|nr:hypothetical protein CPB83DRAFT_841091 [Crepidotus variabilis]
MALDRHPNIFFPPRTEQPCELGVIADYLRRGLLSPPRSYFDGESYQGVIRRLRNNIPLPPIILSENASDPTQPHLCIGGADVLDALCRYPPLTPHQVAFFRDMYDDSAK